jgi:hypothetical protein
MTDEERERLLRDAGRWRGVAPGHRTEPAFIRRQKDVLVQLQGVREAQLAKDQATIAELQEKANRLKHGGGV